MKLFGSVSSGATDNDDVALFLPLEYRPWSKAELLSNLCRDRDLPLGRQFRGCESHIRDITPVMSLVQAVAIALRASARRSRKGALSRESLQSRQNVACRVGPRNRISINLVVAEHELQGGVWWTRVPGIPSAEARVALVTKVHQPGGVRTEERTDPRAIRSFDPQLAISR